MAEEENANSNGQAAAGDSGKTVKIQRIYVKDLSFESPQSPTVFTQSEFRPEFKMNVGNSANKISDDTYEVVLTVSVEAVQGDKAVFLAELQQAGLFTIAGFSEEELQSVLGAFCPSQLYPFAREVVTSTVTRGGFPAPQLQPLNFDKMFMERQQGQQAAAQGGGQA